MRFGTTGYFIGIVKLVEDFKLYHTNKTKNRVVFCTSVLSPALRKSRKKKPLTRIVLYFFGTLGSQVETHYKKGDYVLVQGRLKIFKKPARLTTLKSTSFPVKSYQLSVIRMALVQNVARKI